MATITVIGSTEELEKINNVIKTQFDKVIKKAKTDCDAGEMLIVDAYSSEFGQIDGYTHEQTLKAMQCHSNKDRNCKECPYAKEKDCENKVLMDGAMMVQKLLKQNCSKEDENE